MKQVRQWGFDYVKLDFLYGGALPGKRSIRICLGKQPIVKE